MRHRQPGVKTQEEEGEGRKQGGEGMTGKTRKRKSKYEDEKETWEKRKQT